MGSQATELAALKAALAQQQFLSPAVASLARTDQRTDPMAVQNLSFAKGGTVGTAGKIPVALRFDDWQDAFKANVWPLLTARRIPAGMALISAGPGTQPWFTTTTWADVVDWNKNGLEIWSHGTNHLDPSPDGYAGLVREIVTSKAQIEAQGIRCMGWMMPGASQVGAQTPYGSTLTLPQHWNSDAGRLLQATYGLVETDMTGKYRHLPSRQTHGLGHATVSDNRTTATPSKDELDVAIRLGYGIEFMCHAGNLGGAGHLPLSEFVVFLDYLVAKRDAGEIEIVLPSTLPFCDPGSTRRLNLIANGGFEQPIAAGMATQATWINVDGVNRLIVDVPDSPAGGAGKVLRIIGTTTTVSQAPIGLIERGLNGMTLICEVKCRAYNGATSKGRVLIQDRQNTALLNIDYQPEVTSAWTTLRVPFTPRTTTDQITIALGRISFGSGMVEFDDCKVYAA